MEGQHLRALSYAALNHVGDNFVSNSTFCPFFSFFLLISAFYELSQFPLTHAYMRKMFETNSVLV